jgi:hypothetical protein
MLKPITSIVMPGIRVPNWTALYESIKTSTTRPFELIIISPFSLPENLQAIPNIKYIKDYGNIVRCHNMGLVIAEGKYVTNIADDGLADPGAIDRLIDEFEALPPNPKNIIEAAFTEGGTDHFTNESYHIINNSPEIRSPHIGNNWYIFHQGFLYTDYMRELGYLDYRFEVQPMALIDFAVRAYRDGAQFYWKNIVVQRVTHLPGHTGDHGPACDGQAKNDVPLFQKIHRSPETLTRTRLNPHDWKKASSVWDKRFGSV